MKELTAREKNHIICAVNSRQTAEQAGLTTEAELDYYKTIWDDAQQLFDHGGVWPVFDLWALD